jgi:hypothetical protein
MTSQKELLDMINSWNRMILQNDATIEAALRLREPVVGHPDDSIVYSYLNYLRANFDMHRGDLISDESEKIAIGNGVKWLSKLGREPLEEYLSRGYDTQFQDRIRREFEKVEEERSNPPKDGGPR